MGRLRYRGRFARRQARSKDHTSESLGAFLPKSLIVILPSSGGDQPDNQFEPTSMCVKEMFDKAPVHTGAPRPGLDREWPRGIIQMIS
jgi:hypothetical protein